jgi:tetratricopeptide (TPR) repeat protein
MATDARGITLTGATPQNALVFDAIISDYLDYKLSTFPNLKALCAAAPDFAMAHLMKGFLLLSLGSNSTVPAALACAEHVTKLQTNLNTREALHLQALKAWATGNPVLACKNWDDILFGEPRDILALKLQHFSLFWLGRAQHMRDAAARVLPAWDDTMTGHAQVLGMYAFGLEETGDYMQAEKIGRAAVESHPDDLWAIHAVAHVYEMRGDLSEGTKWLNQPLSSWDDRNPFKDHLWWHTAMFAYERGDFTRVLGLYDAAVWPDNSTFYLDVQNAASLLARLEFSGVDVGQRWKALSTAAQDRNGDHVLLFTEPHYTMAFGHEGAFDQADSQIASLERLGAQPGAENAVVVNNLTLPICNAIRAYYQGDYAQTIKTLMPIRYDYQPIGGSHAQRDVFNIFLMDAAIRNGDTTLARALLAERAAAHPNSFSTWQKYADLSTALGDTVAAEKAQTELSRIKAVA